MVLATGKHIIDEARSEGRTVLTEVEAKQVIKQAGISVVDTKLATSEEEAISISRKFGLTSVGLNWGWRPPSRWAKPMKTFCKLSGKSIPRRGFREWRYRRWLAPA